jgi:hypothetical protein
MARPQAPRPPQTPEQIRRSRNRMLGLSLAAFVVLVFLISIAKMG